MWICNWCPKCFTASAAIPVVICCLGVASLGRAAAATEMSQLEVYPKQIELRGVGDRARFVALLKHADGRVRDVTDAVILRSDQDAVRLRGNEITALAIGDDRVVVSIRSEDAAIESAVLKVQVEEVTGSSISFRREVLPILTRQQCNSGGCHGSPSGKGGFRLSLFAFDPQLDQLTLTQEEGARRVNPWEPDESLILLKPLMRVSHGGGKRLNFDTSNTRILREWIAQGCPVQPDEEVSQTIEILPGDRVLHAPHWRQHLAVTAVFPNGLRQDVTDLADFFSSDDGIATVDSEGRVTGQTHGEAAIVVRYQEQVRSVRMTFLADDGDGQRATPRGIVSGQGYIDQLVGQKLTQMQYPVSPRCDDSTFVRRVYLDLLGVLPDADEARRFVSDKTAGKRRELIDRLLEDRRHARYWSSMWADLFRIRRESIHEKGMNKFAQWLESSWYRNQPFDEFVRAVLTATGDTFENPAANYFRTASSTDDCVETTCQTFLGIRIQCAKCHNHPYERWTQDNYYGLSSFFSRIQRDEVPGTGSMTIWVSREGHVTQPRTGQTMSPWLPGSGELASSESDMRQQFADWLCDPQNPFVARMEVNRIWSKLLGTGIVDPIDDFRQTNPPSHPHLLDALAQDFVQRGFDRRRLIKTILYSDTYQRSSAYTDAPSRADDRYFGRFLPRRLAAEQLLDAICIFTGVAEVYEGFPAGTMATQVPDPALGPAFLRVFGKPARNTACACERSEKSDLSQVLEIVNGSLVEQKVRDKSNRIHRWIADGWNDDKIVDELFWVAYSRSPSPAERLITLKYVAEVESRAEAWEDLAWSIINRKEFLFQH